MSVVSKGDGDVQAGLGVGGRFGRDAATLLMAQTVQFERQTVQSGGF